MRVQAEPTEIILKVDGVPCRIWNAVTVSGEQVFLFVHRVASRNDIEELIKVETPEEMKLIGL